MLSTLVLVSKFDHGRSVMLCYLIHGSLSLQRRTGSDKCPRGILLFGRTALAEMLCMQLQRPPVERRLMACLFHGRGCMEIRQAGHRNVCKLFMARASESGHAAACMATATVSGQGARELPGFGKYEGQDPLSQLRVPAHPRPNKRDLLTCM